MRRIIFLALFFVIFASPGNVFAASSKYEITTKYLLENDGSAKVTATISATNISAEATPKELVLPIVGKNSRDLSVKYQDGAAVTNNFSSGANSVTLQTGRDFAGEGKTWGVTLSYTSDLAKSYGATKIFDVRPQDYGDLEISQETIVMQGSVDLGEATSRGPKPELTSVSLGEQSMKWISKDGAFKESVGIVYGESSVADFNLTKTLKNNSWWWQTLELVLPPDTNQQSVVLSSIEPRPKNLRLDLEGNIIAQYRIRPKGSVKVTALGEIHLFNYSYALSGASGLENIPSNLKDAYTSTNQAWNGDVVDSNTEGKTAVSQMVQAIFEAAVAKIPAESSGIEEAEKWSNALVGELRSAGIPARLILGQTYADGYKDIDSPQSSAWVEAYVPATGWVTLDPMTERGFNLYGSSDVEHISLVMRGVDPGYPPDNLTDYTFSWKSDPSGDIADAKAEIRAVNKIILPGLAIRTVTVKMGAGSIVDDAAIEVDGEGKTKLGSLAPLQESSTNMLVLGGATFASTKVNFGLLEGDNLSADIVEATTSVSYLPMILLIVGVILAIALIIFIKKKFGGKSDSKTRLVMNADDSGMSIDDFDLDNINDSPNQAIPKLIGEEDEAEEPEELEPLESPIPAPETTDEPTPVQSVTINAQKRPGLPKKRPRLIQ